MKTVAIVFLIFLVACGHDGTDPVTTAVDAAGESDAVPSDGMLSACSVAYVIPAAGSVDVGPNPLVLLGFTCCPELEGLLAVSVLDEEDEDIAVVMNVQEDCNALSMYVATDLDAQTTYSIVVPGGPLGIRGPDGATMADDFVSTFTTGP